MRNVKFLLVWLALCVCMPVCVFVQGFKSLQANDGRICPFTLNGILLKDCVFPKAHTCFNREKRVIQIVCVCVCVCVCV